MIRVMGDGRWREVVFMMVYYPLLVMFELEDYAKANDENGNRTEHEELCVFERGR